MINAYLCNVIFDARGHDDKAWETQPFMGNVNILKLKRRTCCHVSFLVVRESTAVVGEGVTFLR